MQDPVVLTGITGFIAKPVAAKLLNAGYTVRGTLRDPARADELRAALNPHLTDPAALERLGFTTLDLTRDEGWDDAMAGAGALVHTASPFPATGPKDEAELIGPAVEGTRRALAAARKAAVGRVVMTSSVAAVMHCDLAPGRDRVTEGDWTDPDHPTASAYTRSKTLAERAAWDFVADGGGPELVVLNPGFVVGAPFDARYGTSLRVIERLMRGKDPMLPHIALPVVHLDDVAEAHLRALSVPEAAGQRFLLADETLTMAQMGQALKDAFPARRIPTRQAPDLLIRAIGVFDPSVRMILPTLGFHRQVDSTQARNVLGIDFAPAAKALTDAGRWLEAEGRV